jgi:hypothetical protein
MYKPKSYSGFLLALFCLICLGWLLPSSGQAFCNTVSGLSCMNLNGTRALLAHNQAGLNLLDLQEAKQPYWDSCFKTPGNVKDMANSRGYAYLADSKKGLLVLDVQDPLACKQVSSYSKFQHKIKLLSAWENLLLADLAREGLTVMDISNPAQPSKISTLQEPSLVKDMILVQGYAYLTDSNGNLHVFDLREPTQPAQTARLKIDKEPLKLGISQDKLYLTTQEGRMHILDISQPDTPDLLASVKIGNYSVAALAGESIYLVDQENYLRILDISDPSRPKKQAGFKLPRPALALCIKNNIAYLHLTQNQLWALDLQSLASGQQQIWILDLATLASK